METSKLDGLKKIIRRNVLETYADSTDDSNDMTTAFDLLRSTEEAETVTDILDIMQTLAWDLPSAIHALILVGFSEDVKIERLLHANWST